MFYAIHINMKERSRIRFSVLFIILLSLLVLAPPVHSLPSSASSPSPSTVTPLTVTVLVKPGNPIVLTANASGGSPPYSCHWFLNGSPLAKGGSVVIIAPSLLLSSAVNYTFTVRVTDSLNNSAQATASLRGGSISPPIEPPSPLMVSFSVIVAIVGALVAATYFTRVKKHA